MNKVNRYGLTTKEYKELLKECGMCTKKWTIAKLKEFHTKRLEIINSKKKVNSNKGLLSIFKRLRGTNNE